MLALISMRKGVLLNRAMNLRALALCVAVLAVPVVATGCSSDSSTEQVDPTPERIDGSESTEFEPDDIERAEEASDAVKDYCAGAKSEAQRIGCESHVTEEDIP